MTSGYDKRQRFSNRQRFLLERDPRDNGVGPGNTSGSYALVSEEVVSFRDDVIEAKRVPEDEVDPFLAGYHRSPGGIADYFDPGRRLLQNMENSGLLTESDLLLVTLVGSFRITVTRFPKQLTSGGPRLAFRIIESTTSRTPKAIMPMVSIRL